MRLHYECHVTLKDHPDAKLLLKIWRWKYSVIDGDPVLGPGLNAYATKHFPPTANVKAVVEDMNALAQALKRAGFVVVRQKVELVIYDERMS